MKRFFLTLATLFLLQPLFCEEDDGFVEIDTPQINAENPAEENAPQNDDTPLFERPSRSFFITAGPLLLLNFGYKTESAPSRILYSLGFGADFRQNSKIPICLRASFFMNYYLFDGENARPAEIENRTATVLSFLFDGTTGKIFEFSRGKNSLFVSGGLGFLARIGFLSRGVSESDDGESGDAGSDVSKINSWFYKSARFLYPELCVSFLRAEPELLGGVRFGVESRVYIPFGSIISGNALDGMIITLSLKASF